MAFSIIVNTLWYQRLLHSAILSFGPAIMSSPLEVVKAFLAGIKAGDTVAMGKLAHPDATACLIRNGVPLHTTVAVILGRIATVGEDLEMDEVSYSEVEHVDGDFATVWTPYRFYEKGKVWKPCLILSLRI
jgi:ketosteroid isomerase-like protein